MILRSQLLFSVFVFSVLTLPYELFAGNGGTNGAFQPLVPDIPFIGGSDWVAGGFTGLLQALIGISVGLAAVLAVIMLAIGGFKYMTTDSAFSLGNAKEQISNAIIGLLIVLTAVLILNTINPQLTSLDVFRGVRGEPLKQTTGGTGTTPGSTTGGTGTTPGSGTIPNTPPPPPTTGSPNSQGPGANYGGGTCPQGQIADTNGNCQVINDASAPPPPPPPPAQGAAGASGTTGCADGYVSNGSGGCVVINDASAPPTPPPAPPTNNNTDAANTQLN